MFGYSREAVRVKVKKCEGKLQPELRKFSVDPQITSLEVLQSILTKAFDIKSDFSISYKTADDYGHDVHLPLLSDWDLDAAFLKAHNISVSQRCEPCVLLRVDMKPFAEATEDWEPSNIPSEQMLSQTCRELGQQQQDIKQTQTGFQGLIMNQVEKTFNMVSRALNLYEDPTQPPRAPLSDAEFRTFLDPVGQITHIPRLREVIYCGGIDPSLRKVVWKHILNVYPDGMTGKERMDYMKRKAAEYCALRTSWKDSIQKGQVNAELAYVTSMVRKDVLRTDRHHKFYAGSDDNQNIASLFNILTTYALNHPLVSYCQGMSDLASPLLVTMGDEAHAYICLCALMARLHPNFLLDGQAMTIKFSHLTESLQVYDPEFYNYLKSQQADDLLFCYRWLLLEMKREFAFEDALRMLEVLWASLPQKSPINELALKERDFDPSVVTEDGEAPPLSPLIKTPRENAYTKVCSIRRQSSAFSLANITANKLLTYRQMNHSLDENVTRKVVHNLSLKHAKEFQSLDDADLRLPKLTKDKKFEHRLKNQVGNPDLNEDDDLSKPKSAPENGKHLQPMESKCLSSSTGNLMNGRIAEDEPANDAAPLGSQIRMLRDKISMHNQLFSSLDNCSNASDDDSGKPKARMIKNLNEFLNLASGNKVPHLKQDKLIRTQSAVENTALSEHRPSIVLTKTSFDESDLQTLFRGSKDNKLSRKIYKLLDSEANDSSSPDDSQEYYPMTTSMTRELRLELEHLDRQVFGPLYVNRSVGPSDSASDSISTEEKPTTNECDCKISKRDADFTEISQTQICIAETSDVSKRLAPEIQAPVRTTAKSIEDIFLWENPLLGEAPSRAARGAASCPHTPDEQAELDFDGDTGEIIEELSGKKSITPIRLLRKSQPAESREPSDVKHSSAHSSESNISEKEAEAPTSPGFAERLDSTSKPHKFFSNMSQELENARKSCETLLNPKQTANLQSVATTINNFQKKYEILKPVYNKSGSATEGSGGGDSARFTVGNLPPPHVFGGGNPFLMFLCLTVLLQHRDFIMRNRMDYNELAMHFDKMVRKHNVNRVLNQARQMYAMYLKQQACKISDVSM